MAFAVAGTTLGSLRSRSPLAVLLAAGPAGVCSVYARHREISLAREPVALQRAHCAHGVLALGLGPLLWMVGVGHVTQVNAVSAALHGRTDDMALRLVDEASRAFLLNAGIFAVLVCFWAPLCAALFSKAISTPISRLAAATKEVVEEGNQTRMDVLPTSFRDEAGVLSDRFNDLLDMMRDLSRGADAIASGRLHVKVSARRRTP